MQPRSVYVHIPFCKKMCHYCDFATYTVKGQPVDAYLDALEAEMHLALHGSPAGEVHTIFVGGGTPTVLTAAQMERFLSIVGKYFPHRSDDLEFTVEANPGTVDLEKLAVMRDGGVNRLSLGAQSFDDRLLQAIGRDHDARTVIESIDVATSAGFHNISLDLMYGLPGQTVDVLDDTLEVTLRLGLQHVSAYALKIEENTLFYSLQRKGQLSFPRTTKSTRCTSWCASEWPKAGTDSTRSVISAWTDLKVVTIKRIGGMNRTTPSVSAPTDLPTAFALPMCVG